jgi:hypothetical protein
MIFGMSKAVLFAALLSIATVAVGVVEAAITGWTHDVGPDILLVAGGIMSILTVAIHVFDTQKT